MTSSVHLVIIGSEILNGFTLDTNTKFIANELFALGLRLQKVYSLRDDHQEVLKALKKLSQETDLLITTGGLGPTDDDLTIDILCELMQVDPVYDEFSHRKAKVVFNKKYKQSAKRGADSSEGNLQWERILRQTRIPKGAVALKNEVGLAPGVWIHKVPILALPGFPVEIKSIWPHALEKIKSLNLQKSNTAIVPVWGWGESSIFSMMDFPKEVEVGVHALGFGCRFFLTSKDQLILEKVTKEMKSRFPGCVIESPLMEVIQHFITQKKCLGTVESCTGGLLAKLLTDQPGVSQIFKGSVVCYSNDIKNSLLNVDEKVLNEKGAVSKETVCILALEGMRLLDSDIILATTGIAGPEGGSDEKPVGTVYTAIADKNEKKIWVKKYFFPIGRERFREAVSYVLFLNLYQKYIFFDNTERWENQGLGKGFEVFDLTI